MKPITVLLATILLAIITPSVFAETPSQGNQIKPSAQLKSEHDLAMVVVAAVKKEVAAIRRSDTVDTRRVRQMLDFFTEFVDRCHHAKEERFYFPAVVYHNDAVAKIVEQLGIEHDYSRSILEELAYVLDYDEYTPDFVAERLERYAGLLERHIARENSHLFPKADIKITGAEERAILIGFKKIEEAELGSGFHEKYEKLAKKLTEQK